MSLRISGEHSETALAATSVVILPANGLVGNFGKKPVVLFRIDLHWTGLVTGGGKQIQCYGSPILADVAAGENDYWLIGEAANAPAEVVVFLTGVAEGSTTLWAYVPTKTAAAAGGYLLPVCKFSKFRISNTGAAYTAGTYDIVITSYVDI